MKKCSFCWKLILDKAVRCKFCKKYLDQENHKDNQKIKNKSGLSDWELFFLTLIIAIPIFLGIVILGIVLSWY